MGFFRRRVNGEDTIQLLNASDDVELLILKKIIEQKSARLMTKATLLTSQRK